MKFEQLATEVKKYNPNADIELLEQAYIFASKAHEGQLRVSGEPFINHPVNVAIILATLELDVITIIAGLLHDVVEDTEVTLDDIENKFGSEVALLVDGVTKLSRIQYKSKMEQKVDNLRKMFLAMAKDIRVIMIKLADRLHNMRTLKYMAPEKQKETAHETLEIYAPLAHRLGIYKLKWELEDLAFRFLEPEKYYELVEGIAKKRAAREEYIKNVINIITEKLSAVGIKADIQGRPKNFHSIYNKMREQNKELHEIYDLMAIRVLVDTVNDCYGVLGIIHSIWKPMPGRFKDYIAMPKSNLYQSLHTTVIGLQGEPLEIQIRTWEMHRTSEYGIAAHWRYKEGSGGDKEFEQKLSWLRQLLEWQNDMRDAREFMETLKIDLFSDTVFVFTPKGEVVELPSQSVPIDFAYRIHTQVGHRCVGAKVNNKLVPLDYKLKNGDIVEIVTSKQASGPSRDWLNLVKTSEARSKIRAWFKKENRDENILKGKDTLEREIKKLGFEEPADFVKIEKLTQISKKMNFISVDDLYCALGMGVVTPQQVIIKVRDENKKDKVISIDDIVNKESKKKKQGSSNGVIVKGEQDVLIRLARCCNPVPGDPIVGYITRGRGVSVHRDDCRNVKLGLGEENRMIEVSWDMGEGATYHVHLEISASDRAGLLNDVMTVLSEMKISVDYVSARTNRNRTASIDLILEVISLKQLENIMGKLRHVKDVYDVWRVTPRV